MASDAAAIYGVTHEDEFASPTLDPDAVIHSKNSHDGVLPELDSTNQLSDIDSNPPIGLSTDDVNRRIIALLTESLQKHEQRTNVRLSVEPLIRKDLCLGAVQFLGTLAFVATETEQDRVAGVIYLMLLFAWLGLNVFVKMMTNRIRNTRVAERVRDILNSFSADIGASIHAEFEQKRFNFDPPNSVLIPVYRNREWKRLPTNVLVTGDVFKLKMGDVFPCDCRLIVSCDGDGNLELGEDLQKFGEVCANVGEPQPHVEFVDGSFMAQSDAMLPQLRAFLDCKLYGNPFINHGNGRNERNVFEAPYESDGEKMKNSVWDLSDSTHFSKLHMANVEVVIYLGLTALVALLHMLTNGLARWRAMLFSVSTLLVCFAFPGFEPVVQLADIWGNVKLQSLFNWHNEKRLTVDITPQLSSSSSSTLSSDSKAGSVDSDMDANQIPLVNHLKELNKVLRRGLDSAGSLLRVLSSVTLLCFVDDVGMLTEGCATLQEIAIIKGNNVEQPLPADMQAKDDMFDKAAVLSDDSADVPLKDYGSFRESSVCGLVNTGSEHLVILDIFSDSSQYGKQYVRFNNEDERGCLPQLLPLSFAMSVAQFPRYQPLSLFRLPPELIHTYVGMLSNEMFSDFTDCLCTFTGSIGLKRSFSRRYRLMRFVMLIDEAHGANGKLLLFFLCDPRKQIVQMFAKGKLEMLLERNLNYHNHQQGKILGVNRLMKRKLKDLNMQWVSSGMVSFAYAYKPIHLEEFNLLMAHLDATTVFSVKTAKTEGRRKRKYMYLEAATPINMQMGGECIYSWFKQFKKHDGGAEPWAAIPKATKKRIVKGCIGDMVSSCLKNTILLGMSADKRLYPKEVPSRIQSFHEAGVRFVYFSKHDERQTRVMGAHLGLETSWNSMISLANSERSTHINQEGNVVLPSGIENIKRHIEEVDDIPLQVSLFANCNPGNTAEMLRILRSNGETIMCIGGGLRPSNFYVFREAHSSLSVAQGYHPVCRFCRGKRWSGVARAHMFDEALPEMKLSAALTSLPCDLQTSTMYKVADPYYVMEMLYEVFRVARHVSTNIQEAAAFLKLASHSMAWLVFLQSLGFSEFIRPLDFALTLFAYIPMIATALLSNPADEKIMQTLPNKIHSDELKMRQKSVLRTYPRLCLATLFTAVSYCLCLFFVNRALTSALSSRGVRFDQGSCDAAYNIPLHSCVAAVKQALQVRRVQLGEEVVVVQPGTPHYLSQISAAGMLVFYLLTASSSWVDKYGDGGRGMFYNLKWVFMAATVAVMHITITALRIYLRPISAAEVSMLFPIQALGFAPVFGVLIVIFDQVIKYQIRRDRNVEQKFLQLLFTTRLGMWSPK
ncbi:uncharacterized protein BcabD6B2_02910 [Babesia caballi]|uniref:Conserved Plasmodium membrane protein homolog n=1 Tax=Babesia caballi TaxID=5871 RepID=A0AAV4LLK8_BABCB|nr:conserved Plasmodium membrane protein homolog [Babesia caballi]